MVSPLLTVDFANHGARQERSLGVTDGEINFLWSFMQGSIAIPETWRALMRGFGFCERHAWIHLGVEMAFRKQYLLGPAILYRALARQAFGAFRLHSLDPRSVTTRLVSSGPCFLCAMRVDAAPPGVHPQARLTQARDTGPLIAFASRLEPLWRPSVCALCAGAGAGHDSPCRCRPHLIADKGRQPADLAWAEHLLAEMSERLARFENSFTAGAPAANDAERAAFITAVGWCSGWRPLLELTRPSPSRS
jgi:hypothetical protein